MRIQSFVLVFILGVFSSSGAMAQSKKELAAADAVLAQRLGALESRMLTGDPAAERLMQRMDALEASQRSLTGEVERLRFERDSLQSEVQSLAAEIVDLQALAGEMRTHLEAVEIVGRETPPAANGPVVYGDPAPQSSNEFVGELAGGGRSGGGVYAGGSSIPGPPTVSQQADPFASGPFAAAGNSNDIVKLADIGHEKMAMGDFAGAQTAYTQYLDLNPDAGDRGDIYYWLGESYYVKGGFADAAEAYLASMRATPKGEFAPDSLVRLAATARALGNTEMACQTLASFPAQFPSAPDAVRAKARTESQRSGC